MQRVRENSRNRRHLNDNPHGEVLIARERILGHPLVLTMLVHELAALLAHQKVEQQMCARRLHETTSLNVKSQSSAMWVIRPGEKSKMSREVTSWE